MIYRGAEALRALSDAISNAAPTATTAGANIID
jgi:hypothetical protein